MVILTLSDKEKTSFCNGNFKLNIPNNVDISYYLFGILIDIATHFASNRNTAIHTMMCYLNKNVNDKLSVRYLLKK